MNTCISESVVRQMSYLINFNQKKKETVIDLRCHNHVTPEHYIERNHLYLFQHIFARYLSHSKLARVIGINSCHKSCFRKRKKKTIEKSHKIPLHTVTSAFIRSSLAAKKHKMFFYSKRKKKNDMTFHVASPDFNEAVTLVPLWLRLQQ